MCKNGRTYSVTCALPGDEHSLQLPDSAVEIVLPPTEQKEVYIEGIHLDSLDFLDVLTVDECLIAPIVELHRGNPKAFQGKKPFLLKMPHCLDNAAVMAAQSGERILTVRRRDELKKGKIDDIPMMSKQDTSGNTGAYYMIDDTHIYIYTHQLSAFLCTSCKKICNGMQNVFICGGIRQRGNTLVTEIRPYICNLLTNIEDFEKVKECV